MSEYLIRTTAGEWPPLHHDRLAAVLIPSESAWRQTEGWGDLRMSSGDVTIAFSGEETGWQVIIEGPLSDQQGDEIVQVITAQVADEVGEPCGWIRID